MTVRLLDESNKKAQLAIICPANASTCPFISFTLLLYQRRTLRTTLAVVIRSIHWLILSNGYASTKLRHR